MSASLVSDAPLVGISSAVFYTAEGDTTTDAQTAPRAVRSTASVRCSLKRCEFRSRRAGHLRTPTQRLQARRSSSATTSRDASGRARIRSASGSRSAGPSRQIRGWRSSAPSAETKYRALPRNPDGGSGSVLSGTRSVTADHRDSYGHRSLGGGADRAHGDSSEPAVDRAFGEATMTALVDEQMSASRFTTWILGLFAGRAGAVDHRHLRRHVVSGDAADARVRYPARARCHARRRRPLGPPPWRLLIAFGTVIGVAVTGGLYRLFRSLLFEVTALDISSGLAILSIVVVAVSPARSGDSRDAGRSGHRASELVVKFGWLPVQEASSGVPFLCCATGDTTSRRLHRT